ncbi:MAG: Crp/Fnr family transcriptional regulator [Ruminococcaceae bacterium]|nr:Crp/Fnr family transcriptional regulator [Oscillospiraceae bacterium]
MEIQNFFPVWNKLSHPQQELLRQHTTARSASKGTILYSGSTECTGLILIKSGQLRAYILSPEGREITVYRLFERDICLLSASCIMRSLQFEITIEAEKDTDFLLILPDAYRQIMEESAPLANFTNEVMASRFSDVMWLIEQVMWKSFDKRLAKFLLEESVIENSDQLKITHEAIGNHLGSPREVVTRMLRYFQNEGMVKLSRGRVILIDRDQLNALQDT